MNHEFPNPSIYSINSEGVNTTIKPPFQESTAPVIDLIAPKVETPLYLLKKVTHESSITNPELTKVQSRDSFKPTVVRSLFLRRTRAKLLKEFKALPHSDRAGRSQILSIAANRDRLAKEFLNQGEIQISFPTLGEQSARFTVLNPRLQQEQAENEYNPKDKAPIVIVPGISNELDSIEAHAQEVASSGRKVIALGYPEAHAGKVTEEFTDAVTASGDLSYHALFFKEAINALTQDETEIGIWGLSTGAPIVAEILSDPRFQEKVSQAVLIGPAGSVDQSVMSMNIGGLKDIKSLAHSFSDILPSFVWFSGKKGERDAAQKELRKKIFSTLQKTIARKSPHWETMRVKPEGRIIVITGGKDEITKSYKEVDEFSKNPQVQVALMPNETHLTSFNSPEVLSKISELQNASQLIE